MPAPFEAFFLPVTDPVPGQRFCIFHPARGPSVQGAVLYVHPFAEEMNKSRRMAAMQSRALADAGYSVLQIDLLGCGDSSGDFGDATWKDWVDDVVRARNWLRSRDEAGVAPGSAPPLWLWGLRAGCLLAAEAASHLNEPCHFLFWQPPTAGKQLLQQFLRLKVAGDMLGGQAKGVMEDVRHQLSAGTSVEIAGYMLPAGLAMGMEQSTLSPPAGKSQTQRLEWLELSTREEPSLSPVSTKTIAQWQQAGFAARSQIVNGPSFWQTAEIEDAPALVAATVAAVSTTTLVR